MTEEHNTTKEMSIPDYVTLKQKCKCDTCKLNRKNVPYRYTYPQKLKYIFCNCSGEPMKRTQCKKRCRIFSTLFNLSTATIIVGVFGILFMHLQDIFLAFMFTVIFGVGMDIICCIIEYFIDKIFDNIEKFRRKKYDKKLENLEIVKQARQKELERKKKEEKALYKDINDAKKLVSDLSQYVDKLKNLSEIEMEKEFRKLKKENLKTYKELLKNVQVLLVEVTLENFYFPEIKKLFQIQLPYLIQYIRTYIEHVENDKVSEAEIKELTKLLESFNTLVISIVENLKNSDSENLVYKMQALREVITHRQSTEED